MKRTASLLLIGAAALVGACNSNDTTVNRDGRTTTSSTASSSTSSNWQDNRILSILHAKNQEEVRMGQLAQANGSSQEVRRYGERLVRDHTDADNKVMSTARSINVTLMDSSEVDRMLLREKGMSAPARDPMTDLQSMRGSDFDRAFAQKMEEGHREVIQMVESARTSAQDSRVRGLLDQLLPTLREHEKMAADLANK